MTEGPQSAAPGWYPQPDGQLAYWDGSAWTATAPAPPPVVATPAAESPGNGLAIAAIVMGALALLFLPIILGPAAIICGGIAMRRGQPLGRVGLMVGVIGMVAGFILGAIVVGSTLR